MDFPNYYSIMLYTKNQAYIFMGVTLVLFVCWFHVINGGRDDNQNKKH
jgi:hypothetical protein